MPLPWEMRMAQEAGWHVPSVEEIELQKKRGKIHQISMGDEGNDEEGAFEDEEEVEVEDTPSKPAQKVGKAKTAKPAAKGAKAAKGAAPKK